MSEELETSSGMKWVNALSTRSSLEAAVEEVVKQAQAALPIAPDLGFVFISSAFTSEYSRLMPLLKERLPKMPLIGCSGGGVVGSRPSGQTYEIEGDAALSLTLVSLPGVKVCTFQLVADELPDLDSAPDAWVNLLGVPPEDHPHFVLLADPFSSKVNDLLQGIDFAYPGSIKVGGLAGSGSMANGSGLFCDYGLYREGVVGVALSGNIVVETIVAQGCRPIGQTYVVTEGDRNILMELAVPAEEDASSSGNLCAVAEKRSPLEVLQELIQSLSEEDRQLAQSALFVGIAQSAFKQNLEAGDFLIRNLLGVDPRAGAIAIGDRIRPGQRIQFHLRDSETSAEDLEVLLQRYQRQSGEHPAPAGALMFSCMGRGEGLYGEPNFDSRLFNRYLENVALSGFFCNGEIGPVGDSTFLHGYTSVFGIFRQP